MLNVPELERRWKSYRRTRQIPYVVAGFVSVLVIAGVTYVATIQSSTPAKETLLTISDSKMTVDQTSQSTEKIQRSQTVENNNTVSMSTVEPATEITQTATTSQTKLTPSMNFMNDFESDVMDYYISDEQSGSSNTNRTSTSASKPSPQPQKKQQIQQQPLPEAIQLENDNPSLPSIVSESTSVTSSEPIQSRQAPAMQEVSPSVTHETSATSSMVIQRDDDMKDIQDVIARFKKNKNPALSLFVAKRYYGAKNYQQAYNYALMTNELDSNIEDSWLIFAKSLYMLDQKDMAIKTLKAYIQQSGSVKAKITLGQMESGTFNE